MRRPVISGVAGLGVVMSVLVALGHLRRRYLVVTVVGRSMEPTLSAGDRLLVRRVPAGLLRRGQVVVLRETRGAQWVIKRVVAGPGDPVPRERVAALRDVRELTVPGDRWVVLGDNPAESVDSRQYGYVPADRMLGMVVRRFRAARPLTHRDTPPPGRGRAPRTGRPPS